MTTNQEPICFRYDGSEEADQAWRAWRPHKNDTPVKGLYYYIDGYGHNYHNQFYRLVTPAEFLRIVTGESQWRVGDECSIPHNLSGDRFDGVIKAVDNDQAWVLVGSCQYYTVRVDELRPIRKSVREELHEYIKDAYNCFIPDNGIDRIIDIIKQRKDEL